MFLFVLQLAAILLTCRLFAWIFGIVRQPPVVGEMAAGIALGPTLFGVIAPSIFHSLFPPDSLSPLDLVSQAGLLLFVFFLGLHIDSSNLRRQQRTAFWCSAASVIAPLLAGLAIAPFLFRDYGHGDLFIFALFIGAALSVTALPVLARILNERRMTETQVGVIAMTGAAMSDVAAWILLALILTLTARGRPAARTLSMVTLPLAFAAGLAAPRRLAGPTLVRTEKLVSSWVLPIFFALTGLRTNLILPSSGFVDLTLILIAAFAGKGGGAWLGGRAAGMNSREASRIGILMNARGLVELIVLNIGLTAGILTQQLFSMMVLMALVTTLATAPLLDLFPDRQP